MHMDKKQTHKKQLLPVYLVNGADDLKRATVLSRLRDRVAKEGDLSFNYDHLDAEHTDAQSVIAACNTLPFASAVRLVQLDGVEHFGSADRELLISYIAAPNATTVLALSTQGIAKNTRLYKAVAKVGSHTIIDCSPIKRRDLPAAVRSMAVSRGTAITDSAARCLIDLLGEDMVALDSALSKLSLAHRGSDPITDNEVTTSISRTAEVKPWEFVDAFAARNPRKCFYLLERLPSVSPFALLSMCVSRIRELICTQSLLKRGEGGALAKTLGMPAWRVKNHRMWARGFHAWELRAALCSARDAERSMKSGGNPDQVFRQWFLGVVVRVDKDSASRPR